MDESIPFTKGTLDNLLGIIHSEADYKYYFDEFCKAQRARKVVTRMDQAKKDMDWSSLYHVFVNTDVAKNIPAVVDFKHRLAALLD